MGIKLPWHHPAGAKGLFIGYIVHVRRGKSGMIQMPKSNPEIKGKSRQGS